MTRPIADVVLEEAAYYRAQREVIAAARILVRDSYVRDLDVVAEEADLP